MFEGGGNLDALLVQLCTVTSCKIVKFYCIGGAAIPTFLDWPRATSQKNISNKLKKGFLLLLLLQEKLGVEGF
jgi:hypothetical protein